MTQYVDPNATLTLVELDSLGQYRVDLLIGFQMSPDHPLVALKQAYAKF